MNYTEDDKIGREEIVNKISSLVDNLQQDKYFCLALNGEWGSGKTYVMGMLQEKFKEHSEYIVINYNAWENNFYSDPLIAILYCLLDGIKDYSDTVLEVKKKLQKSTKKTFKVWAEDMIEALKDLGGKYAAIAGAVQGIINIITTSGKLIKHEQLKDFISYRTLLEEVKTQLNDIVTTEMFVGKQTKLVVMVDEIDRCLPDEQLIVLERLHHMFEIKNCVVIVAMNQNCVVKTVNTIYGIDGYEYLRKFFHFTFKLDTSASEYLKNLFDGFTESLKTLKSQVDEIVSSVKAAYQCFLYGSKRVLDKVDNRELTRYYEGVMNICNDFDWQKLNPLYVFFILVALYIRREISPTFLNAEEITQNQEAIDKKYKGFFSRELIRDSSMPYYDYLSAYIGVDRENPPLGIGRNIVEFSWGFNELIFYSVRKSFPYNEMHHFYNQLVVQPEDCKELCRLVVLYGGEQER